MKTKSEILISMGALMSVAGTFKSLKDSEMLTPDNAKDAYKGAFTAIMETFFDDDPEIFVKDINQYQGENNDRLFVIILRKWTVLHNELCPDFKIGGFNICLQ